MENPSPAETPSEPLVEPHEPGGQTHDALPTGYYYYDPALWDLYPGENDHSVVPGWFYYDSSQAGGGSDWPYRGNPPRHMLYDSSLYEGTADAAQQSGEATDAVVEARGPVEPVVPTPEPETSRRESLPVEPVSSPVEETSQPEPTPEILEPVSAEPEVQREPEAPTRSAPEPIPERREPISEAPIETQTPEPAVLSGTRTAPEVAPSQAIVGEPRITLPGVNQETAARSSVEPDILNREGIASPAEPPQASERQTRLVSDVAVEPREQITSAGIPDAELLPVEPPTPGPVETLPASNVSEAIPAAREIDSEEALEPARDRLPLPVAPDEATPVTPSRPSEVSTGGKATALPSETETVPAPDQPRSEVTSTEIHETTPSIVPAADETVALSSFSFLGEIPARTESLREPAAEPMRSDFLESPRSLEPEPIVPPVPAADLDTKEPEALPTPAQLLPPPAVPETVSERSVPAPDEPVAAAQADLLPAEALQEPEIGPVPTVDEAAPGRSEPAPLQPAVEPVATAQADLLLAESLLAPATSTVPAASEIVPSKPEPAAAEPLEFVRADLQPAEPFKEPAPAPVVIEASPVPAPPRRAPELPSSDEAPRPAASGPSASLSLPARKPVPVFIPRPGRYTPPTAPLIEESAPVSSPPVPETAGKTDLAAPAQARSFPSTAPELEAPFLEPSRPVVPPAPVPPEPPAAILPAEAQSLVEPARPIEREKAVEAKAPPVSTPAKPTEPSPFPETAKPMPVGEVVQAKAPAPPAEPTKPAAPKIPAREPGQAPVPATEKAAPGSSDLPSPTVEAEAPAAPAVPEPPKPARPPGARLAPISRAGSMTIQARPPMTPIRESARTLAVDAEPGKLVLEPPPPPPGKVEAVPMNFQPRSAPVREYPRSRLSLPVLLSVGLVSLALGYLGGYFTPKSSGDASNGTNPASDRPSVARRSAAGGEASTVADGLTKAQQSDLDKAFTASKAGNLAEARQLFIDLQKKHPEWPSMAIEVGRINLYLKDLTAAHDILTAAAERGEMPADANFLLGLLYMTNQSFQEAEAAFARASALDPARPDFYYFWGECLRRDGKPLEAAERFRAAMLRNQYETADGLYRLKYWLSEIQADQENSADVGPQIDEGLKMARPAMEVLFSAAARAVKGKDYTAAADYIRRARLYVEPSIYAVIMQDPTFIQESVHPEFAEFFRRVTAPAAPEADNTAAPAASVAPPPAKPAASPGKGR